MTVNPVLQIFGVFRETAVKPLRTVQSTQRRTKWRLGRFFRMRRLSLGTYPTVMVRAQL